MLPVPVPTTPARGKTYQVMCLRMVQLVPSGTGARTEPLGVNVAKRHTSVCGYACVAQEAVGLESAQSVTDALPEHQRQEDRVAGRLLLLPWIALWSHRVAGVVGGGHGADDHIVERLRRRGPS